MSSNPPYCAGVNHNPIDLPPITENASQPILTVITAKETDAALFISTSVHSSWGWNEHWHPKPVCKEDYWECSMKRVQRRDGRNSESPLFSLIASPLFVMLQMLLLVSWLHSEVSPSVDNRPVILIRHGSSIIWPYLYVITWYRKHYRAPTVRFRPAW